jgi:glycine/D-amino acid oxidase-like deaminating enzyme
MKLSHSDVLIVGAGIIGAACAYECAREGIRVTVIDKSMAGGGATAAGMAHVVVMDDSEAQFALTRYSRQLWQEMRSELPDQVEYEQYGTIWVAADDEEMVEVKRKESFYQKHGVATEVIDPATLEKYEPYLRKGLAGGLVVPEDGVLYAPCAAKHFLERAKVLGAQVHLGSPVLKLGNGSVTTTATKFSAGLVINAAGTWAAELTSGLNIKKRKGHLLITDRYPGFIKHQLVELGYLKSAHSTTADSVAFNLQPRRTRQILIGSSRQYGAEHKEVDNEILAAMLRRAQQYMPELSGLSTIRAWTGFRAATPDKLPLIGPWPEDERLFLATGHEGLGITTSLGTARLLVDQILGRKSAIPIEPYLPARSFSEHVHA